MWIPGDKEKKQYKNVDTRIEYKGYTFGLVGFTVAKVKGKVVHAFEFKPENKIVIAYKDDEGKFGVMLPPYSSLIDETCI